jgi:hypothetical protein
MWRCGTLINQHSFEEFEEFGEQEMQKTRKAAFILRLRRETDRGQLRAISVCPQAPDRAAAAAGLCLLTVSFSNSSSKFYASVHRIGVARLKSGTVTATASKINK